MITNPRQSILEAAMTLFHEQGVTATGVDQILRASKTGKSQFYHYFRSKDGLVHEVMQQVISDCRSNVRSPESQIKSWRGLENWFRSLIQWQQSHECARSCPIGTIGAELRDDQDDLRADAIEFYDYVRTTIASFVRTLKNEGKVSRSCNPTSVADFCVCVTQGGMLVAKIHRDTTPFEHAVTHALRYLRSLRR